MKIIEFTAENVKKLKVVDITPTKDFIQITGANGSGKSSVLDSIWWALAGTKNIQDQPIRRGEEKAMIRLNLGEIVVTRRFTQSGTTLTVENAEGFKAASPQSMLDTIIGHLAFDPLEFSRMDAKKQFDTLRKVAAVKFNFEEHAKADKEDTDKRRDIGRDVKMLEGELAATQVPEDATDEPVDVQKLMSRLTEIEDSNSLIREEEIAWENTKIARAKCADIVTELEQQLIRARERLMLLDKELETKRDFAYQSTDAIKVMIAGAEAINNGCRAKKRKGEINASVALQQKHYSEITARLESRAKARIEILQNTPMPIAGLSLGEGHVIFNDIPFAQLSAAEQLRVSTAIAMAGNPKLRVIRIKDGSLLDDASLKVIQNMAAEKDYQVWCESVNTSGKIGIVMEDGEVSVVNE